MPQDYVLPANAVLVNGVPLRHEWEAAPGSAILPGDLVCFDTNYCTGGQSKIKEAPADHEKVLGVADLAHSGNRDTVYAVSTFVRVLSGNIVVAVRLYNNVSIICGDNMKSAASGEVTKFVCEAGTVFSASTNPCLRVGQALASYTASTVYQWILMKFLL